MKRMDTVGAPPRTEAGSLATGALLAAAFGFVLGVSANPHTNHAGTLAIVAAGLAAGAATTARVPQSRTRAVIGAAVALVCLWLLPQRDDAGTAVILAVLFGGGTMLVRPGRPDRTAAVTAVIGGGVLLAARAVVAPAVLLWLVAAAVITATAVRLRAPGDASKPKTTRRRVSAVVVTLVVATVAFTGYVGAESPRAAWFGGGITHGPTHSNEVAITFDDGPNLDATPKIMAILDRYGVKATFFEVGKAIDADPQITRALYDDGQLVGNHSYHHDQWRWLDPRYPELARTQAAFRRAIGTCPVLYRPPHGERTPFLARVVHDHHMHLVLWNVSAGDWATDDAALVARRILAGARPGAILLLHDGLDGNPQAKREVVVRSLPLILDGLRAKGLQPVRLDQLLGTGAYLSCS